LTDWHFDDQRGGLLAETMGTGKTPILIALCLCTLGKLPTIPVSFEKE